MYVIEIENVHEGIVLMHALAFMMSHTRNQAGEMACQGLRDEGEKLAQHLMDNQREAIKALLGKLEALVTEIQRIEEIPGDTRI